MSQTPKAVRYLVMAATLLLFWTLGERWYHGGSPIEMPEVLMALILLNLAFQWEGIARMFKQ